MPRTYACCYCNKKFSRGKLPNHMEKHADEIPENLTPYQVAYDIINNHPDHHGHCVICNQPTGWSSKNQKYHRICRDKHCAQAIKKTYQERMMKVYNKPHLMDDVNHLEKMLAHRKISGKYKWSDGTEFTYTGTYEKNFLEFLDKVMNYESREIISPGPVLEYDYKGKKHKWITDVMILPYNLIVEIKDGGDNKNGNKAWKGTREKTIAKEVMITNLGKYNYIRLTNNDFAQFLGIIAELKMQIVDDTVSPLYRIHENADLFLDSKEDREKLLDFTQNEIRELPREKDTKFIWPNQLMQSKRGNCVDVALLWYDYCKKRNRESCLIRIGYSYKHSNSNNISLSHQFHVMCMYKEDDGNWCIVNNVGPNKLSKELFIGSKNKEATISLFAKEFLPCLKGYIESIYPDAIMIKPIIEIAPDDKMNKFYSTYFNKYNGNKQLFMKNIFTEDTNLDEESLPEAIDNPYMLREAQEWEHLTHMWSNAIDDIIGNVTNSPFEVAKGSYIDHDPETGKEVCAMRTIRPKAELKNREYRDKLKRQMYKLQQKINKAYNVHPSVMFIQYPIDNTNLTEGLIIGITKTSR